MQHFSLKLILFAGYLSAILPHSLSGKSTTLKAKVKQ